MEIFYDYLENQFLWIGKYNERSIPQKAGWTFKKRYIGLTGKKKYIWSADDPLIAFRLIKYANSKTRKALENIMARTITENQNMKIGTDIPCPEGLSYLEYQKQGILFAQSHSSVLIADEMGLGKTIQAIGFLNMNSDIKNILIICPASLKLNWEKEINKWSVIERAVSVVYSATPGEFSRKGIVIINYDILSKFEDKLYFHIWDAIILDESHYIKNLKAQRTKIVRRIKAKKKIALSGTPILNRPIELFSVLNYFDSKSWPNQHQYAVRYCDAVKNYFGWDYSGSSNRTELQLKLHSTFLIRRLKKDVLKELPSKRRQIIEIGNSSRNDTFSARLKKLKLNNEKIKKLKADSSLSEILTDVQADQVLIQENLAVDYHKEGVFKVESVCKFLMEALETSPKIVCFAHHKEVINRLESALKKKRIKTVKIVGDTPLKLRDLAVEDFQNDPSVRVFLGNIQAAGIGLTLTAASHVVFAEMTWSYSALIQAEDRCHRIGQQDSVLIQYLVLRNSIDALMATALIKKQQIQEEILDRKTSFDDFDLMNEVINNLEEDKK